ncbi:MAG: RHS repeat protein, partial [Thermoanaerobaculia bacterium]|nr:RHS repeat protein [Thermoanaerobaculia bacterium]
PFGEPGAAGRGGLVRVRLELPGGLADITGRLKLDLESLGAGGLEIAGAGTDQPPTALVGESALVLQRQSDEPWQEGYNLFLSEPVVLLADLRASAKISRTPKENQACDRCDLVAQGVYPNAGAQATNPLREMLSGHSLSMRFPQAQRIALAELYGDFLLDEAEIEIPSVKWARSPAVRQEPTLNPSNGMGDAAPGTLLHSGEMTLTATDLAIRGRRFGVAFTRTYRSQGIGTGPLGLGWDHVYNQSLRELSNGDVDFSDGRGRRERFKKQPEDGSYEPPPGRFVSLEKVATGWVMIEPGGERRRFNPFGQLIEIADALRTSETTGNALRFTYNAKDELVEIRDDLDRAITLEYTNNRLTKIRDFSGRAFSYDYDLEGRLITVETPPVKTIEAPLSEEPLVTRYAYATPTGNETQKLHQRDDLIAVTDAKNQTWLELTYTDADSDGRAQEVTSQRWGAGTVQLAYDFAQGRTTVTDRRGNLCRYDHNAAGQVTRIEDPAAAVWAFAYDAEGLLTEQTEPLGRHTQTTFQTQGNRRSRGNVVETRVTADSRGPNGSAPVLVTSTQYEEITNNPTRIVDPRGAVTTIERNEAGLPLTITRAAGATEASTTRTTYNAHGQPVEITNPNGNKRRYDYFTSGASKGYPQKVTIDPGGLGITTRWETDARGNVTATIDRAECVTSKTSTRSTGRRPLAAP